MAISLSGTDLVLISATSNTTTTNTTFNANAPNDSNYFLPNSILAGVSTGVTIDGFGLFLWSTLADKNLDMINDGTIAVTQAAVALTLVATGGAVSYLGAGTVTSANGPGLAMGNRDAGTVVATISNTVSSSSAEAITMVAEEGAVSLTQQASGSLAAAPLFNAVLIQTTTGNIHATLNGTVSGGQGMLADSGGNVTVDVGGIVTAGVAAGVRAETQGAITLNSSGSITAATAGLQLTGHGAGQLTVNMTAGKIVADVGIDARSLGSGDILVDMTGGQLGDSASRVNVGIRTGSAGAGDTDITATTIFATGNAIETMASSTGTIRVTVDGVVDSLNLQGVLISGNRPEAATVINNGTIRAVVGITSFRPTEIINAGTIIGTLGAISLNGPGTDDTLTLTPTSVIVGRVFAGAAGNDRLQLGGTGIGHFDVGTIGTGQQYLGFETFNVIGGSWILSGTGADAWNVLGGSLGGSAVVGAVNVASGATLSPGTSTGILVTGNLSLAAGATHLADIVGTTAGAGHDQVQVSGTVNLAGATLSLSVGAVAPGTAFIIIANDGSDAVTGSFAGLAEGAIVDAGTARFSISYQGGSGNDVVLSALPRGTAGDDNFTASAGAERIDALEGIDTVTFGFRLVDAAVSHVGNTVVIDGPSSHTVLTGIERFVFTDGTVENNDGNVLVDDLFYYSRNHDVWNAQIDADAHFRTDGWREGRDPNAFFDTSFYLATNPDVKAAGLDPLAHFDQGGWREGRMPSLDVRPATYLTANPDVAAAGVDPLCALPAVRLPGRARAVPPTG